MTDTPTQTQSPEPTEPSEVAQIAEARRRSAITTALGALLPMGQPQNRMGSSRAVHWLVPGGLAIGLIYVGLYRAGWRVFGEVAGVRLMPALIVWLADVGLFGLSMIVAAARTTDRYSPIDPNPTERSGRSLALAGTVALVVLLVVKMVLWTAIPEGIAGWPTNWRRHFNFLYPWPVYRPLILAPLWGRWALILASGVGRAAPNEEPPAAVVSASRPLAAVLGWFIAVLLLTAIYCGRHGRWMIGCIIGLIVLGVTFLFAVVTARRFSGHTRFTVYAAGFVAEVTFLIAYLAFSQQIYYY